MHVHGRSSFCVVIQGSLTCEVEARDVMPENIVAVVRPNTYNSAKNSKMLDQKFIVRDNLEMLLQIDVKYDAKASGKSAERIDHIYTVRINPTTTKGLHGIYIFPLRSRISTFQKAGRYIFKFSLVTSTLFMEGKNRTLML